MMKQITSRAEFQRRLDRALVDAATLLARSPNFDPYQQIELQLRTLKQWTQNGREPTPEERKRITIGRIMAREFDPQPEGWLQTIMDNLYDIQGYVTVWPPEGEAPYK
ncbi:MAG TPA: immunity protein Tsi6 family protein [Polyangiaceae bacterium]|jgi:hypothetical protein